MSGRAAGTLLTEGNEDHQGFGGTKSFFCLLSSV
jgi:hypothetical protein